ncbi:YbaB/EbfC family nucleoid-associated protein [Nonomuraea sp. SYSU D8015]|uniref:YbaB/EbfC family nucleoid-associated protein n=1 Tax=Nonomuraea sp. SYSU D8015 TaxID=2593644 RepID=UPI001660F515|nr:YbaB/EbfC family nucleoid-associated protein [Nonomuraea sp. SYSU D8015]
MADREGLGAEGLDRIIERAQQALASAQAAGGGSAGGTSRDQSTALQGEGTAANGRVRATVAPGGRLSSLTVDPRLMRAGSEEMCAEIVKAVNAAVDDLRAKAVQQAGASPDAEELSATLLTLQQESVRQMEKFTQAINDVVLRFERRS